MQLHVISAPPGIILCPGRLPAAFISCWTWLYGEKRVGITGGRSKQDKSGCSSLLVSVFKLLIPLLCLQETLS